jgi:hypothetical protein
MGQGSTQRPVLRVYEHIKTVARSALEKCATKTYYCGIHIIIQVIDEHGLPEPSVLRTGAVMCTA